MCLYTDSMFCESGLQEPSPPSPQDDGILPADLKTNQDADLQSPDSESPVSSPCSGINLQHIRDMRVTNERFEELTFGFADTQRESLTTRARLANPRNPFGFWDFNAPIIGAIVSGSDQYRVVWTCTEVKEGNTPHYLGGNGDMDFGRYSFFHVDCNGSAKTNGLCSACLQAKPLLLRRFDSNLKLHSEEFKPSRKANLDRTPSLMQQRTIHYRNKLKNVSRRLSYKSRALEKLTEETGVDCPINDESEKIFDITMEQNVKRFLSSDPNDRLASIAEYVFAEACQKHKQAKLHGMRSIRHSPLVIRLAAAVYASMGNAGGGYDLLARCFGFPTARHLRNYTERTASEADGILHRNLRAAQVCFEERNSECHAEDGKRAVVLKLDEMHIRGRFEVDFTTNKVVGISEDALDKSVLEREFTELLSLQRDEDVVEEVKVPEPNKKFLVFVATVIDKEQPKQQVVVAR